MVYQKQHKYPRTFVAGSSRVGLSVSRSTFTLTQEYSPGARRPALSCTQASSLSDVDADDDPTHRPPLAALRWECRTTTGRGRFRCYGADPKLGLAPAPSLRGCGSRLYLGDGTSPSAVAAPRSRNGEPDGCSGMGTATATNRVPA